VRYVELEELLELLRAPAVGEEQAAALDLGEVQPAAGAEPAELDWLPAQPRPVLLVEPAQGPSLQMHLSSGPARLALPTGDYIVRLHGIPPTADLLLDETGWFTRVAWMAPEPFPRAPSLTFAPEVLDFAPGGSVRLEVRVENAPGPGLLVLGTHPRPLVGEGPFEVEEGHLPPGSTGTLRLRFLGDSPWLNYRSCRVDVPFRRVNR